MPQAASNPRLPVATLPTLPTHPTNALVLATNAGLADKNFRDSVRQMHAEGYPFVAMIEALGLEDDMTSRVRQILEALPDDVVREIRAATIAMLDSADYEMPLECTVTDSQLRAGIPVEIEVVPEHGKPTIHVRALVNG